MFAAPKGQSKPESPFRVRSGLDVTGPIEALVLTLAGRWVALDQLQGDGTASLNMRADAVRRR